MRIRGNNTHIFAYKYLKTKTSLSIMETKNLDLEYCLMFKSLFYKAFELNDANILFKRFIDSNKTFLEFKKTLCDIDLWKIQRVINSQTNPKKIQYDRKRI
jgi:hypothetical protein